MTKSVLVFDFLSHEHMHLPFNEGYLRTVREAFPDDRVVFYARNEHCKRLSEYFQLSDGISFEPTFPFEVPFGLSRHNPLGGRFAGRQCWNAVLKACDRRDVRLIAILGLESNILSAVKSSPRSKRLSTIHFIIHNHVAEVYNWRSRNPLIKAFDLHSGLQRKLPSNVTLIALELGIEETIGRFLPSVAESIRTLEHPVLLREWAARVPAATDQDGLKVAFAGHCGRGKGFDYFCEWANENSRSELEFHAVGLASKTEFDMRGLARRPSPASLSRHEYVAALESCDLVCLPLSETHNYVASGSVIDAIAQLKPLYCIRNNSLTAIEKKYGSYGYLSEDIKDLRESILNLDRQTFNARSQQWRHTLAKIRESRRPEALAPEYAAILLSSQERYMCAE